MHSDNNDSGLVALPRFDDVMRDVFEDIENRGQRGLETGFFELDDLTNGLQNGELIIVAGRPSLGKTALLMNIVEHVAVDSLLPCAVFTLEMTEQQFSKRLLCSRSQIDAHRLRRGMLQAHEYVQISNVVGKLAEAPLWLMSVPGATLAELLKMARIAVRKHGVKLLAFDYLQLIEAQGENRTEQLTKISRQLKALALELRVPVICVSQMNRGMFQPGAVRPRVEDLRGSGTIEDDADVIMLLHREDYYRMSEPDFQPDNIAEVIIAKQRNGPTGTVKLTFLNKTTRFENLATQADPF